MKRSCEKNFYLNIKRNVEELDIFRKNFTPYLEEVDVPEDIISQLELSIYEVLINIIKHNPPIAGSKNIEINCSVAANNFNCEIVYHGEEFDITKRKVPNIKKHFSMGKKNGLGIYIIDKVMDKIGYTFNNGKNRLQLNKRIK